MPRACNIGRRGRDECGAAAPARSHREISAICAITDTGASVWRIVAAFGTVAVGVPGSRAGAAAAFNSAERTLAISSLR